jgi:signal transduction histidine kinase
LSVDGACANARENALAEAIRLAEMRSTFLSHMSHELRTPLNGILGFEQLLQMDSAINEGQRAKLHIIRESGEHLLALVNQILDYAKIEADKLELNLEDMQLEAFLDAVVGLIRRQG